MVNWCGKPVWFQICISRPPAGGEEASSAARGASGSASQRFQRIGPEDHALHGRAVGVDCWEWQLGQLRFEIVGADFTALRRPCRQLEVGEPVAGRLGQSHRGEVKRGGEGQREAAAGAVGARQYDAGDRSERCRPAQEIQPDMVRPDVGSQGWRQMTRNPAVPGADEGGRQAAADEVAGAGILPKKPGDQICGRA